MADQAIIPHQSNEQAIVLKRADPVEEEKAAEKRIKDALELENKLRMINETVPTRVYNTSSSTAGAGSGDFHQYRMIRRTEQQRQKRIDEEWERKLKEEEYEAKKQERLAAAEERTAKRRAQRQKKKQKKKGKKADGAAPRQADQAKDGTEGGSDSEGSESEQPDHVPLD
mmetsp:Transcript_21121/g.46257  ORF Transcript_21121/g.46257 Transcript_21121/m.46257 type:complete len:170 (-) Transcript_21121:447-956(-)|eukprot:CAMPEP_0202907890 /NCGR_PEP_ID=MMETSP1392-20130828/44176_1 /ASSEMBLY_ACC=CAM_ASM_000868 /TAXON_ID=225041 /ORGANISM="Chlamydomonas chlamydogama, Strain SAG 11-48b" /LENGTH=169 /DNA_ID=CAMNT_0049596969 /DNA_START=38 /DNA_END=547 /DNA_ORIENTATION=+